MTIILKRFTINNIEDLFSCRPIYLLNKLKLSSTQVLPQSGFRQTRNCCKLNCFRRSTIAREGYRLMGLNGVLIWGMMVGWVGERGKGYYFHGDVVLLFLFVRSFLILYPASNR